VRVKQEVSAVSVKDKVSQIVAEYRQKVAGWTFLLTRAFCKELEIERKTGLNAAFLWDGSLFVGFPLHVSPRQRVCFPQEKCMFCIGKVYVLCS